MQSDGYAQELESLDGAGRSALFARDRKTLHRPTITDAGVHYAQQNTGSGGQGNYLEAHTVAAWPY